VNTIALKYTEKQIDTFNQYREKTRFKVTDPLQETPVCIEVEQKGKVFKIGTLGNILLVQAKGKAGKTYFTSALTASLLTFKQFIFFRGFLPEDKRKVIYFDTEQGTEDARTIQNRIYKMADLPIYKEAKNFEYYCLRGLSASDRCDLIEYIIYNTQNLGAVIIDGVRDLINDFNDTGQSFIMINKLMTWTEEKRIHIITILHQNPNDEKARGHLGTELTNKAEFIISINRNKMDDSYRTLEGYGRRKSFSPFNYTLDANDFPVLSTDEREAGKIDPYKLDLQTHKNILSLIFSQEKPGLVHSLRSLQPLIKIQFKKAGSRYEFSDIQCRDLVHYYLQQNLLKNSGTSEKMKLTLP